MRSDPSDVGLRVMRRSDRAAYVRLREANAQWLDGWEARDSDPLAREQGPNYHAIFRAMMQAHRAGHAASFAITLRRDLVGHIFFSPILWGSIMQAHAGYWVAEEHAGKSIVPLALARASEEMLRGWGLNRIEVLIQPSNAPSLAVMRKLPFRAEGVRRSAMRVGGAFRDHAVFALTRHDLPQHVPLETLIPGYPRR